MIHGIDRWAEYSQSSHLALLGRFSALVWLALGATHFGN
ncbi:unnamed protein product [Acidithrix sp. C25]|nr:unnamed protein product [Acidithrix sp. C25]